MTSVTPVERPKPAPSSEKEALFRSIWYTDELENSETMSALGQAANSFARSVLKSPKLPGSQVIQQTCERLSWNDGEAATSTLASGCDCSVEDFIWALDNVFGRYASEQLSPRFAKGGLEWKTAATRFAATVAKFFNARVAAEKAYRIERAKVAKESPADVAKLCAKGLPQVAAMEVFVGELAEAIKRSEGGFGGGGAIRSSFLDPLAKLRRFLEAQIAHFEKVERDRAAAVPKPDNTPARLRG